MCLTLFVFSQHPQCSYNNDISWSCFVCAFPFFSFHNFHLSHDEVDKDFLVNPLFPYHHAIVEFLIL